MVEIDIFTLIISYCMIAITAYFGGRYLLFRKIRKEWEKPDSERWKD